jgi:hypothetical protein
VVVAELERVDAAGRQRANHRRFAVCPGARLVADEVMRHAKHPVCQCGSGRIGQRLGNDLALLRNAQCAPEISDSCQKDVETAEQPELMVLFIKRFREFESTSQC